MYRRCKELDVPMWLMADHPAIGDPEGQYVGNTFMTASSMKHASQAHRIRGHWTPPEEPKRVLEIGGGYGGMLTALLRHYKVKSYSCVDAPPMHVIRRAYVRQWMKQYSFEPLRFQMTDWSPEAVDEIYLDHGIDLAIASNALVEMPAEAVAQYMDLLHKCMAPEGAFYTVNSKRREIKPADFPWDDRWEFRIDGPAFGDERYSEILAVRK
jgi:putative sugar O-methyltransferase